MSILKPESTSFNIHYNDLINLIANDLNVKPTEIITSVKMREAATDYFSSGCQVFDYYEVHVKNEYGGHSKYNLSVDNIKELIANSFNMEQEKFDIDLNIQHHPVLGEQINQVTCSLKKLSNTSSIDDNINKINLLREKYFESINNNKKCHY